jgi:hypothetical protein
VLTVIVVPLSGWLVIVRCGWPICADPAARRTGPSGHPQRRQVVRPHVEHRARAALVEEIGVGMPRLRPAPLQKRQRRDRCSDHAVVDQLAAGL